ncbi:MAG TPA: MaoC family dehydratase [Gemmatimonadales bacterium]|jgi:acyl dehydratase
MPLLYFDDLHLGQQFVSGAHTMTETEIIRFAGEYDPQPFHTDADAARHSLFRGLVASGWHTGAVTMRLLVTGPMQLAGGVIGVGGELSWPNPVRPGDTLRVYSEVASMRPSKSRPELGLVAVRSETRNQDGVIVQILVANLFVPKRPAN